MEPCKAEEARRALEVREAELTLPEELPADSAVSADSALLLPAERREPGNLFSVGLLC